MCGHWVLCHTVSCSSAGIPVREDGARLDADPGVPAEDVGLLDDVVGLRVRRLDVAEVRVAAPGEVVAEALVDDRGVRVEGGCRVGDGGKHLPVDRDQLGRVLRLRAALGHDRHHRLALPGRGLKGKRVLRRGLEALEVGEHPDPGVVDLGELAAGHDRDDPRRGLRGRGVDRAHARVGVRGPDERRVPGPPAELDVVHERAAALGEARRVGARERSGRCRSSGGPGSRIQRSAMRSVMVRLLPGSRGPSRSRPRWPRSRCTGSSFRR